MSDESFYVWGWRIHFLASAMFRFKYVHSINYGRCKRQRIARAARENQQASQNNAL